ncbi:MAG: ATP synthase F1 subunit epsilon [Alphaproteobacteria bacterium]|nr:ATP synthase F1 subunit epsilon [Alphaproteobacteria bacterium]
MREKVAFELISPEKLLISGDGDMVLVPGAEGDFGVLPDHSLLISGVRPGVLEIHNDGKVDERIFVSGGVAEVTPERCIVLAEQAVPVDELDTKEIEARISDLRDDVDASASDDDRKTAERALMVTEAMRDATTAAPAH